MKMAVVIKNRSEYFLSKTARNHSYPQLRTRLFGFCFVSVVLLSMVFMFSVNGAYGARKVISWQSMFEDAFAYENAMRASGILRYDRIQDATDMLSDANAYEQDARAFINEYINRGNRNSYEIERDFNDFHEKRLMELQRKWGRSKYLVECATKMAEFVRDSNMGRIKSLMSVDSDRAKRLANRNDSGGTTFYSAPEEREILDLVERATVFVVVIHAKNNTGSIGTGFFVAPGIVLTNRHVIGEKSANVLIFSKVFGRPVQARIVAISDRMERDYALLRLDDVSSGYPDPLTFSADAKPNDKVTAWGYPRAAIQNDPKFVAMLQGDVRSTPDVVYSDGVINSIQNQDPPFLLHNAIVARGSSGGPLVNRKGQVLGINTSVFLGAARQSGAAISATDIMKFMREHGISPTQ